MGPLSLIPLALAGAERVPWAGPRSGDTVRIAVVGSLPDAPYGLVDAVRAAKPDLLVLTGVDRDDELTHWPTEGGVLAFPDAVPTRAHLARFPGMGGERPAPYGTLDVETDGVRWRLVYLSTQARPVSRLEEQGYWLPGALSRGEPDRLIVLSDAPRHSLSESGGSPAARALLDRVQDGSDPLAFAMWIAGNTGSNEVFAPGGAFGELHLVAGASGGRRSAVAREGSPMPGVLGKERQVPAWSAALTTWMGEGERVESPEGFWVLELRGESATLDFHMHREGAWTPDFRLVRDRRGWRIP